MSESVHYKSMKSNVLRKFMDRTFYKSWGEKNKDRRPDVFYQNYNSVELILNQNCDLDCKYCYVKEHGKEYFPIKNTKKVILGNLNIFADFLIKNKFSPKIELFGGDVLAQSIGHDVLELLLDKVLNNGLLLDKIVIPTNSTFLMHENKIGNVESLMDRFASAGVPIVLSLSIDGKYMDENRPFVKKGIYRDDAYYDRSFEFAKKHGFGFHPMIYSSNMEKWIDNFLWFQSMFNKYDIHWTNIYLLEVRNKEWNDHQIKEFSKFVDFIIRWSWNKVGKTWDAYWNFLRDGRGFNMLSSPWMTIGRGIGCSIQSTIFLRAGDLSFFPCHRLMYNNLRSGKFVVNSGEISGVEADNLELFLTVNSLDSSKFPVCSKCVINKFCSKGCLGSQYEVTGDLFSPIPTVCKLEHAKVYQMMKTMADIGIIGNLMDTLGGDMASSIRLIMEEI